MHYSLAEWILEVRDRSGLDQGVDVKLFRRLMERPQQLAPLPLQVPTLARIVVEHLHPDREHLRVGRVEGNVGRDLAPHQDDVVRRRQVGVVRQDQVRLRELLARFVFGERGEQDGRGRRDWLGRGRLRQEGPFLRV